MVANLQLWLHPTSALPALPEITFGESGDSLSPTSNIHIHPVSQQPLEGALTPSTSRFLPKREIQGEQSVQLLSTRVSGDGTRMKARAPDYQIELMLLLGDTNEK